MEAPKWEKRIDDKTKVAYYYNSGTMQSQWEAPEGFAEAPLWTAHWDETHSAYYYLNSETHESSWEKPEGFVE